MDPGLISQLTVLYSRFCVDFLDVAAVREGCFRMVESGNEQDCLLAILVAYPDEPRARMEELLAEALQGLGGAVPTDREQRQILAEVVARQILDGSLDPGIGAYRIYWHYGNVEWDDFDNFGQLAEVYDYFQSECAEGPDRDRRLAETKEEIIEEARKLLRRVE